MLDEIVARAGRTAVGAGAGVILGIAAEGIIRLVAVGHYSSHPVTGILLGSAIGGLLGLGVGHVPIPRAALPVVRGMLLGAFLGVGAGLVYAEAWPALTSQHTS